MNHLIFLCSFIPFILSASLAFALTQSQQQNAIIQDNLNQQKLIRQNQDLERQKNIAEIEKIGKTRNFDNNSKSNSSYEDRGGCINLKKIKITGSTLYSQEFLRQHLIKSYHNRCFKKSDLKIIRKKVENFYITKGYTTTRVYFKSQSLAQKVLTLVVVEGKIEQINIKDNSKLDQLLPYRHKSKSFVTFPFKDSGIFNLRDFEQGVDQINRLQSYNAQIDVRPGTKRGHSNVIINSQSLKPINLSASYNNMGQESSGKSKRTFSANIDGVLGLYDNFYINFSKDNAAKDWKKFSKSIYSTFSIPLGYWTFAANYSASSYLTTIDDPAATYQVSGESRSKAFDINRVLTRNQSFKTKLGSKLTIKDTKSFIEDAANSVGTHKLSILDIYLDNIFYSKYGTINIKPSFSQGLDIFNATSDSKDIFTNEAHAQFKMAKLSAYFNTNLSNLNLKLPWQYTLTFSGQASQDTVLGTEKFSVGGPYSVRGFEKNSISGDSGYMINNDLKIGLSQIMPKYFLRSKPFNYNIKNTSINNLIARTSLTLFYDYGYTRNKNIINDTGEGYMSGTGVKFSYLGNHIRSNLTLARSLSAPKFIENIYNQEPDKNSVYFDISLNF